MPSKSNTYTTEISQWLQVHSIGHFSQQPDHRAARKTASDYLLIWVLGGKGFGKTRLQRADVSAGHLLSFPPKQQHAYGSDTQKPWDILWVHFGGKLASKYMQAIEQYGHPVAFLGHDENLRGQFEDLMAAAMGLEHIHQDTIGNQDILTGQMLGALLGRIIYLLEQQTQNQTNEQDYQLNITELRQYIHRNLTTPLTLQQMAESNHLSVTHFSRLFRRHFGTSPMHYIIEQRMARAAALLTETTSPISLVGNAVGYEDAYYFSRLFKRIIGMTPRDYRKQNTCQ